ncbi:hypothetical protein BC477_18615 [Clavibacter michiganensis subsp. michiganensis]|uniref:Uncharacterized protein n=1 Tax=Clavibacter michiganensis subsp. michiganensis TaxID=33013 RepID=A0A251XH20_CLAMM|nr:hypothetical protein BC477_18615 [Clavibacter michiganensis subsp. michiganensis]OUE01497.1 hypothetical protein CMMCAS07_14400 [Clavibacter michiganensis subsp. michiganensis]
MRWRRPARLRGRRSVDRVGRLAQVPAATQPDLERQRRERRDRRDAREERRLPPPPEADRGDGRDDHVEHERDPVQAAEDVDAELGRLRHVLEEHADEEAGPRDRLDDRDHGEEASEARRSVGAIARAAHERRESGGRRGAGSGGGDGRPPRAGPGSAAGRRRGAGRSSWGLPGQGDPRGSDGRGRSRPGYGAASGGSWDAIRHGRAGGRDRCGRAWGMCIACERGVREVLTGHVSRITVALCDHFHMRRNSPRRSGGINWGSTTLPSAVPRHGGRAPHPHAHDSSPPSRGSASG